DRRSIQRIVDTLCRYGAHAERWLPKAGMDGRAFDLRVLTIAGEPSHVVGRLSRSPITNLHLLNHRADHIAMRSHLGDQRWVQILAAARSAAACFPETFTCGVDVMITPWHAGGSAKGGGR